MFIVYKISNKVNDKIYVGITKRSLGWRWSCHKSEARRGSSTKFHKAIRKYGEDVWELNVLCECASRDEVSSLEDKYIVELDSIKAGYNSCRGGYQSTKLPGYKHTAEALTKIANNAKSRKVSLYQFDEVGTFIQKWDSALDAAIGVYGDATKKSNITKCANRYDNQVYVRAKGFPIYSFGKTETPPPPAGDKRTVTIH